jgi:hypothetical protein
MSETQSIKTDSSVNAKSVETAPVAKTTPAAKAAAVVATLREVGTAWAEAAIGYGRVALENVAHALERTAGKLGALQEKLKKDDVATPVAAR